MRERVSSREARSKKQEAERQRGREAEKNKKGHAILSAVSLPRCVALSLLLLVFLGPDLAHARELVPAPPMSEALGAPEPIDVGPIKMRVTAYHSYQRPERVEAFYQEEMSRQGWTKTPAAIPLGQPAGWPAGWEQAVPRQADVLYFRKQDHVVAIRLERAARNGTTVLINDLGNLDRQVEQALRQPEASDPTELPLPALAHDPTGLPVYPEAVRTIAQGHSAEGSLLRMYRSEARAEDIETFYHTAMVTQGWTEAKRDARVQRLELPPTLARHVPKGAQQAGEVRMAEMEYRRGRERCQIVITEAPVDLGKSSHSGIVVQWMRLPAWEAAR